MSSQQRRPPIEDFFKPYGRSTTIPQKRPSSSGGRTEDENATRRPVPKTPAKSVTFKDVTPKSTNPSFFSPTSRSSLPIRSPKPDKIQSPGSSRQTTLFNSFKRPSPRETKQNTSFTFSDISEHSQKIIKDGKLVAVRDSDDDTNSLESLDDIFGRGKDVAATSDSSPPEDIEAERIKTLSIFTSGRSIPVVGKDKLRALYAKERAIKFDLSSVLDDHFGDVEAQQNITRMRAGFDGVKDTDEYDELDTNLLASVVQTGDRDQDEVDRLLNAVERTEALSSDKRFYFFRPDEHSKTKPPQREPFPNSAIPDQMWVPKDTYAQERAFLSGYITELAALGDLEDEALRWTFHQVAKEPHATLRQTYVQCLKASSEVWTRFNVTTSDIQALFQTLGADPDCIRDASLMEPKHQSLDNADKQDYKYLLSAIQLFQVICADMDFLALSKLSSIVLRVTLDSAVMSNKQVSVAIESLLETLLVLPNSESRNHVYNHLTSDITRNLQEPQLQVQLLSHILPTTSQAIELRKTLADFFLLGSPTLNPETSKSNASLKELSDYISNSPSFSLTRHSNSTAINYSSFTAQTQILNVAVSAGNPPSILHRPSQSPSKGSHAKLSAEEIEFDNSVDVLADKLHNLFVSIKDTGASHMRRTEAKDALQALYFRLLFSVRTRPRKKKHVFDANGEMKGGSSKSRWVSGEEWREKERGGEFMKRFLTKKVC